MPIQIKTLELLIIRVLHTPDGYNERAHRAFTQLRNHFSDEEYLYGICHGKIIQAIYIDNFYKTRSAEALTLELHIDVKTLLGYRKIYLILFAKYYLNLTANARTDLFFLYEQLREDLKAVKPRADSPS